MTSIEDLIPTEKSRVVDLVSAAGLDVSDWSNYGKPGANPSSNPKYCYQWSFMEPGKTVVVNLWLDNLSERNGQIVATVDLLRSPLKGVRKSRARSLHEAVQHAYEAQIPVKVIICQGKMRDADDPESAASKVKKRELDSEPWSVVSYDRITGAAKLIRGVMPLMVIDQFVVNSDLGPANKRPLVGETFVRSASVRSRVLNRSRGRCELCGELGFECTGGKLYVETHHVISLADGGSDTVMNVVALCANDHRQAHFSAMAGEIKSRLLSFLNSIAN